MAGQASPLFSIVTPVYQPPVDVLADTIASVRAQEHTDWEWVLVDDASPDPEVRRVIADASADDPRIRLVARDTNGHIVAASNDAVAEATGEFLVLPRPRRPADARRAGRDGPGDQRRARGRLPLLRRGQGRR